MCKCTSTKLITAGRRGPPAKTASSARRCHSSHRRPLEQGPGPGGHAGSADPAVVLGAPVLVVEHPRGQDVPSEGAHRGRNCLPGSIYLANIVGI